ncbi:MAG: Brp/Blh family beta-carotene 15,15'-dioxygenase [Ferruginibacter sp.]|nr:Brp/Blh family beta-carotene 15,15'-dioxygenase [Ferruginibacter sp.]
MLRSLLLVSGVLILAGHWLFQPISANGQFIIFLTGIIFLGIPHGAADLLVANKTAESGKQKFNAIRFFAFYISRLIIFGALIYFLPAAGILLFLLFAAYHFGETDLHFFNTNSVIGKMLVSSYGLVILSVILLNNMDELQQLTQLSGFTIDRFPLLNWVAQHHYLVLSVSLLFFFSNIFLYFILTKDTGTITEYFLVQFAVLVFLLFNLPLLTGFTFYFIVWHSVLSLQNIISYLKAGGKYSHGTVVKQVVLYSSLAFIGILIVGSLGFMFISNQAIIIYIFLGLAVLTAPHMQIMHDMYGHLRTQRKIS